MPLLRRRLSSKQRWWARTAIVSIVGYLFFQTDGLVFDLTPWAQAVINSATSLGYPSAEQSRTVVALFTQDDVARNVGADEPSFPIPYRLHAAALRSISSARPRAIFIDFAFIHDPRYATYRADVDRCERETPSAAACEEKRKADPRNAEFDVLTNQICAIAKVDPGTGMARTEIFVVDTSDVDVPAQKTETFGGCATAVGAFIDRENIASGVLSYPKRGVPLDEHGHAIGSTEVFPASREHAVTHPERKPPCGCGRHEDCEPVSAAYALWLSFLPCERRAIVASTMPERMALIWPARAPPAMAAAVCRTEGPGLMGRFSELYERGPEALKRSCPYTRTVTVSDLLHPAQDFDLDGYLGGKTVLYGAKLAMTGDFVRSPVFAELPAVYYHAVAFDNLEVFAGHPKTAPPWQARLLIVVLLFVIAGWLARHVHVHEGRAAAGYWLKRYSWAVCSFIVVVILGFAGVLFEATHDEATSAFGAPEPLLLGCFALYLLFRLCTEPRMAMLSTMCFALSLLLYHFFSISFEKFLSMILFFEVVHLMLHYLPAAANRLRADYAQQPQGGWSPAEYITLRLLEPFLPDEAHR